MDLSRLTSKGQLTVPRRVREAAGLAAGDVVVFAVEGERVLLRKLQLSADPYLRSVEDTLTEWNGPEDEDAWRDL